MPTQNTGTFSELAFLWLVLPYEVSKRSYLLVKDESNKLVRVNGGRIRRRPSERGL